MIRAAVYCRVSTDNQEREGTSLQTQLENCLTYCQGESYDVSYRFSEAYSGLSLERPEMDKARELVRAEDIDVLVCYSLDRLTRDPGHGVIITQELEKHHVRLETVSEDTDNSELGKLISYIRGFASKLEAEKIRERTMRGKKAWAKQGRMTSGGFARLYGYNYIRKTSESGAKRTINETEATWVRQVYQWLVNDSLSTHAITNRLRASNAPTKFGKPWSKQSVQWVLKNRAYTGQTYAFTTMPKRAQFSRPESDWIEVKGATPAIISQGLFDAAQKQIRVNRSKTMPQTKHEYLLRGYVRCGKCGKAYTGTTSRNRNGGKYRRYYRCGGQTGAYYSDSPCQNKAWNADLLESLVWQRLNSYLSDKKVIQANIESQREDAGQAGAYQAELKRIEREITRLDRQHAGLLHSAVIGEFTTDEVQAESKRIKKDKDTLNAQKNELEARLKASQDAVINTANLESFITDMQKRLPELDYAGKREVLGWLGATIYLDGTNIEIVGIIEPEKVVGELPNLSAPSRQCSTIPFSLKIAAGVV